MASNIRKGIKEILIFLHIYIPRIFPSCITLRSKKSQANPATANILQPTSYNQHPATNRQPPIAIILQPSFYIQHSTYNRQKLIANR